MNLLPSHHFFIHVDFHKRSNAVNKYAYKLKEHLDVEIFKKSIKLMLERHKSFKQIIVKIGEEYKIYYPELSQVEEEMIREEQHDFHQLDAEKVKEWMMESGDKIIEQLHQFEGKKKKKNIKK
jgi:hypothetical protein